MGVNSLNNHVQDTRIKIHFLSFSKQWLHVPRLDFWAPDTFILGQPYTFIGVWGFVLNLTIFNLILRHGHGNETGDAF